MVGVLVLSMMTAGCSGDGARSAGPSTGPRPFVSVAVDNHFHDIHPIDHRRIQSDRAFVIRNDGRNLHNVTVADTNISQDLEPDQSLSWTRIGDHLQPGTYRILCKYHDWARMVGEITVIP